MELLKVYLIVYLTNPYKDQFQCKMAFIVWFQCRATCITATLFTVPSAPQARHGVGLMGRKAECTCTEARPRWRVD